MFIHERDNWTEFRWDNNRITLLIEESNHRQGMLYGRLRGIGFDNKLKAMAENLTRDVVFSSEIEGIQLNMEEVRSSIARNLGIERQKHFSTSHYIDSIVAVTLEAVEQYDKELTKEKLCQWQTAFFPTGFSNGSPIEIGQYRTNEEHIISGMFGRERIHYIAPSPERVESEMQKFITWFNSEATANSIIRSAIAHLWFVSIHPFEDGNGRLARVLSDMMLARGDNSRYRFYNISSEINKDKKHYYDILEVTQRGDGDITEWVIWYIKTVISAINEAETTLNRILNKCFFWQKATNVPMNERQSKILNMFLDGYEAKITSKTWAALAKCSKDTAIRDIQYLVEKHILKEDIPGAKRPSFSIIYNQGDLSVLFKNIEIINDGDYTYLTAIYNKTTHVREKLLKLDAERYKKGDLPLNSLLIKYCSYLIEADKNQTDFIRG